MRTIQHLLAGCLLLAALFAPRTAHAAQSYDNCEGHFIDSLPATISTQGTWCLRHDLSTAIATGNAITVAANNVTIDCNDFKIGGMSAGMGTQTVGIYAGGRLNTTIRHCNVRGFLFGTYLNGNGGNLVEDNRFEGNTFTGIYVAGDDSMVRRNLVLDTGGSTLVGLLHAYGIDSYYTVDIVDNTVSSVAAPPVTPPAGEDTSDAFGISTRANTGGSVAGNQVRNLVPGTPGNVRGIDTNNTDTRMILSGNRIVGSGIAESVGIVCSNNHLSRAKDNVVTGFANGLVDCGDAGGNDITP